MCATSTTHRSSPAAGATILNVARTQLLADISFHTQETFRLKALLNSRRPISKLPSEILSRIFLQQAQAFQEEHLLQWSSTRHDKPPEHRRLYTWTSVALVCRRWRELALECAQLWTCLVLDERVSSGHVRSILARSQGLLLTVVCHASSDSHCLGCGPDGHTEQNYADALDLLAEVLPNTRTLALFVGTKDYARVFDALSRPSRKLEWLHIQAVGRFTQSWLSPEARTISLPRNIFSPGTPPLRHLSVTEMDFDWDSPLILPTLRRLEVVRRKLPPRGREALRLARLLDVLRRLPQLEELELDDSSIPSHDSSDHCDPVVLPHLRLLNLSLSAEHLTHLVSHLRFPKATTIQLIKLPTLPEDATPAARENLEAKQQIVVGALEGMALLGIADNLRRSSFYKNPGSKSKAFFIWAESTGPDDTPPVLPSSWYDIEPRRPRVIIEASLGTPFLKKVLASLDLRPLRIVNMEDTSTSAPRWQDTLQSAEDLTTLHVAGTLAFGLGAALVGWVRPPSMNEGLAHYPFVPGDWVGFAEAADDSLHFAGAIADTSTGEGDDGSEGAKMALSVRFPRLRVLRISRVDFRLANPGKYDKRWRYRDFMCDMIYDLKETPYGLDDGGLARGLRLRAEHGGTRLERLEFADCQCFERERLVPLVRAVPELWWDGRRVTEADLPSVPARAA